MPDPVRRDTAVAAAWGFAEATLFFLVPDVWLTWVVLRSGRAAAVACVAALAGALAGGALMYAWGAADADRARAAVARVPAVGPAMVGRVGEEVRAGGAVAAFRGPLTGTPYKIYAVEAGAQGLPLGTFLLVSVPARLGRFAAVTAAAGVASRLLRRLAVRRGLHLGLWSAFYLWYFRRFGVFG
jgi:membrane protein YqaA with SNARE-associated domain